MNRMIARARPAAAALALVIAAAPAAAQPSIRSSFDRTVVPTPGKARDLQVPSWTKTTLANGAQLIVSERHALPLVSFTITFQGGANQFEPADKRGLASMVASMLSEGTKNRTGDQLSADLQLLGTNIGAGIGGESGSIGFVSTKAKLEPTLKILEDMLVNPTFPADALERLKARTLVGLRQQRDRTPAIAASVFSKTLYSEAHPYGRSATERSVSAVTRDDVVSLYQQYFKPGRAIITVVGDVNPAEVKQVIERTLATWPAGGEVPSFAYPAFPEPKSRTIYLVDKPGAAQSSFALGIPGPQRDTPDYFAIRVMNVILGEQFQSRLNANIREQKGYSYGVGSTFSFGKGPGPFRTGGDIVTAKTDSALIEFMKELRGIRGERPITDEELSVAKSNLIQSLPENFSSVSSVSGSITTLYTTGLPEDYYQQFASKINAVTKEDVVRVANRYIDLERLALIIVGDRKSIEEPLKATGIAPIVFLDIDGNPVPVP
ncbi:MAG TPA: pitrilysin family protein [Gemmatimonadaceae bacterium]|nr:pitrilysin family protein [Gemmatimonadaceae bacterium]